MPRVAPFEALVYDATVVGPVDQVTSRPYDVISAGLRDRYEDRSPYNIVRVDLPGTSGAGVDRYAEAAATLDTWIVAGALRRLPPGYLAYELAYPTADGGGARLRGLLAGVRLEAWGGAILPHEEVMAGPIEDRLNLLRATRTHLSPVYGTVARAIEPLDALWGDLAQTPPQADVTDVEGVRHRTWWVPPVAALAEHLGPEPLLIADGHHRYSTALVYRDERRATDGPGAWDEVLAFIVGAEGQDVPIRPYHRIQRRGGVLTGGVPTDRAAALASLHDDPPVIASVRRVGDGLGFAIHHLDGVGPAVAALHRAGLDRLAPGDDLRFTHALDEAVSAVAHDGAVAAYLLPPTDTSTVLRTVRTGARLPRKSTFFWPKPRTGLAMMPLEVARPAEPLTDRSAPPAS